MYQLVVDLLMIGKDLEQSDCDLIGICLERLMGGTKIL
jgi:hypothetical protein